MTEQPQGQTGAKPRGRTSLLVMAGVGFVPLFLAYAMFFFFPEWIPSGTTNEGVLVQPPVPLVSLGQEAVAVIPAGKWTLLISTGDDCEGPCANAIYLARQVNIGLGKDADRVQRVLVVRSAGFGDALRTELQQEYPEMILHFDPLGKAAPALEGALDSGQANATVNGKIYLVDPNGNIMLYFDEAQGGKPMLKDLKHLLRLSNIG